MRSGRRRDGAGIVRVRPLDTPRSVQVLVSEDGTPRAVRGRRGLVRVEQVLDAWEMDDEWWRVPISRRYQSIVLEGGRVITLFQDGTSAQWFFQGGILPTP
jgi:hypothetical protein